MDQWPRACLEPPVSVTLKVEPADFLVDEVLGFEPSGSGEHCLLRLEKTGLGTPELAAALARLHQLPRLDVGYAGRKDKHAVTRQWFSLRGVQEPSVELQEIPGVRVLAQTRHARKLKPGTLAGNRFVIRLRDAGPGDPGVALAALAERGAPNYFGEQRFGENNLTEARRWLAARRRPGRPGSRGAFQLSVLRGYLFNEVLAARVRDGSWTCAIDGDVLVDGVPSGPLWGRGRSATSGCAVRLEDVALLPHAELRDGLEHAGLKQDRRPLVLSAPDLSWAQEGRDVHLEFFLPAGSYATSLLREAFCWAPQPRRMPRVGAR